MSRTDRLDRLLVSLGLVETRSRASDLVKRGCVRVNGEIIIRPSANFPECAHIELVGDDAGYVSRGALKLRAAVEHFSPPLSGAVALDLGASTGGFCQVLLENGVKKIYAVDVGHDQLHPRIRGNPAVTSLEGQDARNLTAELIPEPVDIITSDLSFISLTLALLPALTFANRGAYLITLIKPQFEAGRDGVGKGGIVRDEAVRQSAVSRVKDWVSSQNGWTVIDIIPSPLTGQGGNQEYLLGACFNG